MTMPYTRKEKIAGLFFLGGLVLIFLGALVAGGIRDWFQSYNTYYALYNEGYGLSPGVKVKFLRTDVGLVTRLELTDNDKVKVHMSILNEYADRIKSDSVAAIASPTFIGSEYVDIIPGTARTTPIPKGGQIPAIERKSLEDYVKDLRLDVMLAKVEGIMVNVDSLTQQLQDPGGPLLGTLSDVRQITSTVAQGDGTLGNLISNEEAYEQLQTILNDLRQVSDNIAEVSGDLSRTLPPVLDNVRTISEQTKKATGTLPDTANRINEGARNANQVLDSAKRNFLIRGNIQPEPEPDTRSYPARQQQRR